MILIDPQQELFSALRKALTEKGMDVYDGALPPEGTPYPFVYLGDCQQIDELTKGYAIGTVYQTVNVWGTFEKRGSVSKMLLEIKDICRELNQTKNFRWFCRGIDQRMLPDDKTSQPLMHGVLDVTFQFS